MNIVISGTVGVGKSTVSKLLKNHLSNKEQDIYLMEELQSENEQYLNLYYENRPSWSFLIQINFVLFRFKDAFLNLKKDGIKIYDRYFLDDYIFASMPMIKNDISNLSWQLYNTLNMELNEILKEESTIDYFFLLKADFKVVLKRIHNRSRGTEANVDIDYWKDMYHQYYENEKIKEYITRSVKNFIIIDVNCISPEETVKKIISYIKN